MVSELDADGSGEIDFDEFIEMMTARMSENDSKTDIDKIFRLFDEDKKGFISVENLRRVVAEIGEHISEEDLEDMM